MSFEGNRCLVSDVRQTKRPLWRRVFVRVAHILALAPFAAWGVLVFVMNPLHGRAEWYNAMTDNCMTSGSRILRKHAASGRADLHWSVILNGYAPDHAYTTGVLDASLPFDDLKRRSRINDRARAAGGAADFSAGMREGLPGMDWMPRGGE